MSTVEVLAAREAAMAALDQAGFELELTWRRAESGCGIAVLQWLESLGRFRRRLDAATAAELRLVRSDVGRCACSIGEATWTS